MREYVSIRAARQEELQDLMRPNVTAHSRWNLANDNVTPYPSWITRREQI